MRVLLLWTHTTPGGTLSKFLYTGTHACQKMPSFQHALSDGHQVFIGQGTSTLITSSMAKALAP